MRRRLVAAVLSRGNGICTWCACNLDAKSKHMADRPCVDFLDGDLANRASTNVVASCFGCSSARSSDWPKGTKYTTISAMQHHSASIAGPSTFSIYLDTVRSDLAPGVAFHAALARVEAQRWNELEVAA